MKVEYEAGTDFLKKANQEDLSNLEVITESVEQNIQEPSIIAPASDIVTESYNPDDKSLGKENPKLNYAIMILEEYGTKFINWVKKSIAMMIIFMLLGCAFGMYVSKMVYDFRMNEISQLAKTGTAGYVHKGQIFDVKIRP